MTKNTYPLMDLPNMIMMLNQPPIHFHIFFLPDITKPKKVNTILKWNSVSLPPFTIIYFAERINFFTAIQASTINVGCWTFVKDYHTLYILIFSSLFALHFLSSCQGEFLQQSRSSLVGDHFLSLVTFMRNSRMTMYDEMRN